MAGDTPESLQVEDELVGVGFDETETQDVLDQILAANPIEAGQDSAPAPQAAPAPVRAVEARSRGRDVRTTETVDFENATNPGLTL